MNATFGLCFSWLRRGRRPSPYLGNAKVGRGPPAPPFFLTLVISFVLALPALAELPMATNVFQGPFYIYKDFNSRENHGTPSGWMGDYRDLKLNVNCTNNPQAGTSCLQFTYSAKGSRYADMVGVMWQNPANNAGDIDGGMSLAGATQLTFWARGETGRELIDVFMVGGTVGAYPDSDKTALSFVRLKPEWTQYAIDLTPCDLQYISSFFGWVAARFHNREGLTMYLDEIKIE